MRSFNKYLLGAGSHQAPSFVSHTDVDARNVSPASQIPQSSSAWPDRVGSPSLAVAPTTSCWLESCSKGNECLETDVLGSGCLTSSVNWSAVDRTACPHLRLRDTSLFFGIPCMGHALSMRSADLSQLGALSSPGFLHQVTTASLHS